MSSIKLPGLLLALGLALAGCGDPNANAVFPAESGHGNGWIRDHKIAARGDIDSCAECHGVNLDGGVAKVSCMSASAISGFSCHATSPANNPTGCVSCHGGTGSGPFGSSAPNTQGAHAKHVALTGSEGCNFCHQNAGFGTAGHAKATAGGGISKAAVAMALYSTTGGGFGYKADGTCAAVSCHGGLATPAWLTGAVSIVAKDNAVCKRCHESGTTKGIPQYNSYYSGIRSETGSKLHTFHLNKGFYCTDCHNIGTLTNYQKHFGGLAAKVLVAPENTIGGTPSKVTSYVLATKTCTTAVGCHTGGFSAPWNN